MKIDNYYLKDFLLYVAENQAEIKSFVSFEKQSDTTKTLSPL
jgi:hypothetical protein